MYICGDYVLDSGELFGTGRDTKIIQYDIGDTHIKDVDIGEGYTYSKGRYVTLDNGDIAHVGGDILKQMLEHIDTTRLLCVGIGNSRITTDRLGIETIEKLYNSGIMTYCPSVEAITGLNTVDSVKAIVEHFGITSVIAIDSLCARAYIRLGKSYQLTSAGMRIGGATSEGRDLSETTIGVPTIGIGLPTVISAKDLVSDYMNSNHIPSDLIVTPNDIDNIISIGSDTISSIIKYALK